MTSLDVFFDDCKGGSSIHGQHVLHKLSPRHPILLSAPQLFSRPAKEKSIFSLFHRHSWVFRWVFRLLYSSEVCLPAGPFLVVLMNISKVPAGSSDLWKPGYSHLAICTLWMALWNNQHQEPLSVTRVSWSRVLLTHVLPQVGVRHRMCCFHPRFSSRGAVLRKKQRARTWQGTDVF